ncbi:Phosphoribosyl-ATP pyrophosphohydrolase-domain containing protein [Acanthamoeba polyphaga mimivirus]|uniref:Phosphoribosyl-ATP pyrophosphohydrolase-domain containing protein (Two domains) n=1 Tax=Acanthamoeba polyphaga mimivirus TaxID=212035 RepID=A0A0G2Y827_MIMIV|nr:Phosphoribosyl-ATP pyrophosphohydrolase-domain containing protein (two domains) [Acanthamoeba castellanii mamavirus]AKI79251.1 phosphoribosyl-ATP pyrophosphohydrolase-domain containing protein (two domains) [Acanthamoeba polyphaga mimivirus]EJN40914.1 hypothetical protein lvs_L410 [Acanthamoeba polyphaga lentillevirus]UMZ07998.1 Phosphoribosyl-ATP pyrophosphohydrolase-domain containing protein [Acanthamoeba polyphaga mimivirus]
MTDFTNSEKATNYQAVGEFNRTFGHPANTVFQHKIFDENPQTVKLRLDLIKEEVGELVDAVNENNLKEILDACGDILYVVYGMGQVFGINLDHKGPLESIEKPGYPKFSRNYSVNKNVFTESYQDVKKLVDKISDTYNCLDLSVAEKNIGDVSYHLYTILTFVYELSDVVGFDLDEVFDRVHRSNMSKLCLNEQEAVETIEHYKTLPGFESVNVKYRLAVDNKRYVIYNAESGKILKSKYFKLPNFSDLLE